MPHSYLAYTRASPIGSSVIDALARTRAFLERASDCRGAFEVTLGDPARVPEAVVAAFPLGTWMREADWTWRATRHVPLPHATLETMVAALDAVGAASLSVRYRYALRNPAMGERLPYEPGDLEHPHDAIWSATVLALNATPSLTPTWLFPADQFTPDVVAVLDAAVATLGIALDAEWRLFTPRRGAKKVGIWRNVRFDRAGWVERDPATEQQLLAEIAANRDDDAARLVYADLLTERGDPRGMMIALEHQLARLPVDPRDVRRRKLEALLRKHDRMHGGMLRRVPGTLRGNLRRGFVEQVKAVRAREYLTHVEALRRAAPLVHELVIENQVSAADLRSLAASQSVIALAALHCTPDVDALRAITTPQAFPALRWLHLGRLRQANAAELLALLGTPAALPRLAALTVDLTGFDPAFLVDLGRAAATRRVPPTINADRSSEPADGR